MKKLLTTAVLTVAGAVAGIAPAAAHDVADTDVQTGDISVLDGANVSDLVHDVDVDVPVLNRSCVAPVNVDAVQVQGLVDNDDPYTACAPFLRG